MQGSNSSNIKKQKLDIIIPFAGNEVYTKKIEFETPSNIPRKFAIFDQIKEFRFPRLQSCCSNEIKNYLSSRNNLVKKKNIEFEISLPLKNKQRHILLKKRFLNKNNYFPFPNIKTNIDNPVIQKKQRNLYYPSNLQKFEGWAKSTRNYSKRKEMIQAKIRSYDNIENYLNNSKVLSKKWLKSNNLIEKCRKFLVSENYKKFRLRNHFANNYPIPGNYQLQEFELVKSFK